MFLRDDKTRSQERLKLSCPCYEVALENGSLQPLCFLVYVRCLNRNLVGTEADQDPHMNLDPSEIMFCQNSQGVFDNSYSGMMRDKCGLTGWNHVSQKTILKVLDCLYWFRAFERQYRLKKTVLESIRVHGFAKTRHMVMQTLHTINSLLVKKMIAFSPEIEGYTPIAKHTAWAFSELMNDYGKILEYDHAGIPVEPTKMFYLDAKAFANAIKSGFHKESRLDRLGILQIGSSTKAFAAFFGSELRRLQRYVESVYSASGSDYTLSPAWIFRMTTLGQTRGIGYLPDAIAECKRRSFRMNVNRKLEDVEPAMLQLQATAVVNRLRQGGMPFAVLSRDRMGTLSEKEREQLEDAFSRVDLPIKATASVDTFVKDGGKVEDARLLLAMARKNHWKIPVRDLDDHKIIEVITVPEEPGEEDLGQTSRYLFWISYQLFLNHWIGKSEWSREDAWSFPIENQADYRPDNLMDAKIVHISEPGKERNLTKSHAALAWMLTPGAKLTQGVLAMLKEHRAGLLESGHEWRHQKRISAMSDESGFIYDPMTGKFHREIRHVFKDWTESTDFICKAVGYTHLRAYMDFVDFPRGYKRLILKTIVEPQPVKEVVSRRTLNGEDVIEPVNWTGSINEGFMMGNPMTKTILHLVHESERAVATLYLTRKGLSFRPNYKFGMFPDQARVDRKESSVNQTTFVHATF